MDNYESEYKRLLKKVEEIGGKDCWHIENCLTFPKCKGCDSCLCSFKSDGK